MLRQKHHWTKKSVFELARLKTHLLNWLREFGVTKSWVFVRRLTFTVPWYVKLCNMVARSESGWACKRRKSKPLTYDAFVSYLQDIISWKPNKLNKQIFVIAKLEFRQHWFIIHLLLDGNKTLPTKKLLRRSDLDFMYFIFI